jgi:hypothetical protein
MPRYIKKIQSLVKKYSYTTKTISTLFGIPNRTVTNYFSERDKRDAPELVYAWFELLEILDDIAQNHTNPEMISQIANRDSLPIPKMVETWYELKHTITEINAVRNEPDKVLVLIEEYKSKLREIEESTSDSRFYKSD